MVVEISLSPHHPAQVRCCEVNLAARDGRTGARRVTSRESGLLVPQTRTCTCVDVRAHAHGGVVCGLGPGRDVAGGRPARDARASGRARAHRSRGRTPRRTRNPAPALLPLPRARLLLRALVLALCFPVVYRRPPSGSVLRTDTINQRAAPARFDRSTPLGSLDSLLASSFPGHCTRQCTDQERGTGTLRGPFKASAERPLRGTGTLPTTPVRRG